MLGYAMRRCAGLAVVLWFIATLTFFLMHAVPGGPFDEEVIRTPGRAGNIEAAYGLDDPIVAQYLRFMGNLLQGDLGVSFQFQDRPVTAVIAEGFGPTATLGLLATAFALPVGIGLGVLAALYRRRLPDHASVVLATGMASMPSFVLGILLVTVFSLELGWTPVVGWGTPKQAILPALTLASASTAYIARITRASVLDVMDQDFVVTARAKGLATRTIAIRHILRNASIPVVTLAGPVTAGLVTGSFVVEHFYAIPGIGRAFVQAVFARDYGMIMGTTLFYAAVVAGANLAVDLTYFVIDPRMRPGRGPQVG